MIAQKRREKLFLIRNDPLREVREVAMLQKTSFALKWEKDFRKSTFPTSKAPPFRISEQTQLADVMNYDDLYNLTETVEDEDIKRKQRWKLIRQVYLITRETHPYQKYSFEKTLFSNSLNTISEEHFVMSIINEYQFPNTMKVDGYFQWLFRSFDKNRQNCVDWREILVYYKILIFYRYVRDRPLDLILLLFDIYADGVSNVTSAKTDKERLVIEHANEILLVILTAPCIKEAEVFTVKGIAEEFFLELHDRYQNRISRKLLGELLSLHKKVLNTWSAYGWERLSSDMRLTVLDETVQFHQGHADAIIARRQLVQAIEMYSRNIKRRLFFAWRVLAIRLTGATAFINRIMRMKEIRCFLFWVKFAKRKVMRRRRRILASVIGTYNIKARIFARIKLFNRTIRKVEKIVGTLAKKRRAYELAGCHLREYYRLHAIRDFYHRWWNACKDLNNFEVAVDHDWRRLTSKVLHAWQKHAHERAMEERYEFMVRENKLRIDRMLAAADEQAAELIQLEEERRVKQEAKEKIEKEVESKRKLEESRARIKAERYSESKIILSIQREWRRKRIDDQMTKMRATFLADLEYRGSELVLKAKERITNYIENPENKLSIDMKFRQLKKEFFANPAPETKERERILSSYKNVLFLYLDAKLTAENLDLKELIPTFDQGKKGYLVYKEFANLVRYVGVNLNESQITAVIRGIDQDRDGYISFEELESAGEEILQMGVPGSPWKLYIDPSEDVICYHNFLTNEKLLEYEMKDQVLRQIVISNLYGEADYKVKQQLKQMKIDEWDLIVKNYMARRIQSMYYLKRARGYRARKLWRLQKRELKVKVKKQRNVITFVEKHHTGAKSRKLFTKQLHLTIEKLYDMSHELFFYYNHATKQSSWETPHLIRRFGDVTNPCPWIPLTVASSNAEKEKDKKKKNKKKNKLKEALEVDQQVNGVIEYVMTNGQLHYYHVKARREFPHKPDGYLLCTECQQSLAIRTCVDCTAHYCFACHRKTHGHPLGFAQNFKISKDQLHDAEFVEKLHHFDHKWVDTKPLQCQLCRSTKTNAAFYCHTCTKRYCRQCYYRTHPEDMKEKHPVESI